MNQESSTNTPEQQDHIRGNTKVEPSCLIEYQGDSKKEAFYIYITLICWSSLPKGREDDFLHECSDPKMCSSNSGRDEKENRHQYN